MNDTIKFIEQSEYGTVIENIDVSKHTTYKTGGIFSLLVEPFDVNGLTAIIKYLKDKSIKYFIIGNGSNVIMPDNYNDVVIIKLTNLCNYIVDKEYIEIEAGTLMPKVALELAYKGISGFEFCSGIPGTIGGGVYMNAGAYGKEIKDSIISACVYDIDLGEVKNLLVNEMDFSYRHSIFMNDNFIILSAKFKYDVGDKEEIVRLINDRRRRRVETQPVGEASAGSVFRNPDDIPVWKLIEDCGLRGHRIGDAVISDKHCNMIINDGNATSNDIIQLISKMKSKVLAETGRELILEQRIIKWDR